MTIEEIAQVAHNVNKAYCETIGDLTQKYWGDAEDWQKQSAISGVQTLIDNPNLSPEETHQHWLEYKTAEGWVFGEIKDAEKKTHPCIKPYSELPYEQRLKDVLFKAIVANLLTIGEK